MLSLFVGVSLVVVIMLDMFWTTLTTRGSGLGTMLFARTLQRIMVFLRQSFGSRKPLVLAGPTTMVLLGMFWIGALWLGWVLIFNSLVAGVVQGQTGVPANISELVYYVGFTLSTLGIGDFQPSGTMARILTVLAAFNGLVLVTLIITYALPVVGAAISRRQAAFSISMLGGSPLAILKNTWNGSDFKLLESTLGQLEPTLIQCAEQRLAYPVVDSFFTQESYLSLNLQLAILDEALTLASIGLVKECQPDPFVVERTRKVIGYYLTSSPPASRQPAAPDLPHSLLQEWASEQSGIVAQSSSDFESQLAGLTDRRRALRNLVQGDGWHWNEVNAVEGNG